MAKKHQSSIADLRTRIRFECEQRTSDGQGGFSRLWTAVATVSAKVVPKSSSERYFTEQIQDIYDHEITIRYRQDINHSMRIVLPDGRLLKLVGRFKYDERKFFMSIKAIEGVAT